MAPGRFITYFLSSLTLFLFLLLLLPPNHECSKLSADAAYHINFNDRGNSNAIEMFPFLCKIASNVSSSRGTLTFSRKPAVSLALYGFVSSGLFWMLFAYLWHKSVINENASSNAAHAASSCVEMEDDFNDEYGIMSRRRIRTQNKRVVFNDE